MHNIIFLPAGMYMLSTMFKDDDMVLEDGDRQSHNADNTFMQFGLGHQQR